MPGPVATTPRRRSRVQPVDLDQLAQRVLAVDQKSGGGELNLLPSERELARHLHVSRHAVRQAIEHLEQIGLVRRLPGRGSFAVTAAGPQPHAAQALRCINFLQAPSHQLASMQWLIEEYLVGYNDVLDLRDIKARFICWEDSRDDFESIFWSQAPIEQQGCVLINRRMPELLHWLHDRRVTYVVQNTAAYDRHGLPPHHSVYVNKMGAAFTATRHLLDLGHQRVGFIGQLPTSEALWPEYEGWAAALRCAGLPTPAHDSLQCATEILEVAEPVCRQLLDRPDRPTAVLLAHGAGLVGLKAAAQRLGLSIPRDLSVIGFDSELTQTCDDLSTIQVPRRELGRLAVEMILTLPPADATCAQTRMLDSPIVFRRSTAPPGMVEAPLNA